MIDARENISASDRARMFYPLNVIEAAYHARKTSFENKELIKFNTIETAVEEDEKPVKKSKAGRSSRQHGKSKRGKKT